MFKKIHVYDMDGVLVDTSHRYRNRNGAIDLDHWLANSHKIDKDTLLPLASQFVKDCANSEIYTVLCTARTSHPRDVAYIHRELATPNKIIMRPYGDNTPDAKLKRRYLSRLFNLRQFANLPRFFWEDNQRNIDACRNLFTRCFYIQSEITGK